jgi:Ca-activated chloride channel family protein
MVAIILSYIPFRTTTTTIRDNSSRKGVNMRKSLILIAVIAVFMAMSGCGKPAVELTAPGEANAGSDITVTWTGTSLAGDQIVVRLVGQTDGTKIDAGADNSAVLTLPLEAGAYEIAYVNAEDKTLATSALTVKANTYTLDFPEEVFIGESFEIQWTGPDNRTDYLTIVPEGTPEGEWEGYDYTANGNPCTLTAPMEPGVYEIRYSTEQVYPNPTLFSKTITVISTDFALMAPEEAMAGSDFLTTWIGPNNPTDYITIVPVGTPEGEWATYDYTANGNPCTLTAPMEAGVYEIRYSTEQVYPNPTLAMATITIVPAEVTLSAPASVPAGSTFDVEWTGPDGYLDYVTIVPVGSPEGTYTDYDYTSEGSPISLEAPVETGEYEIWYASDRVEGTFATIRITVE